VNLLSTKTKKRFKKEKKNCGRKSRNASGKDDRDLIPWEKERKGGRGGEEDEIEREVKDRGKNEKKRNATSAATPASLAST